MQLQPAKSETTTFNVETRTLPHIFARTAAQAIQAVYGDQAEPVLMEKLSVEAANPSLLLQAWINLVIRMFYEKRMAFSKFEVRQLGPKGNGWYLQVEAVGAQLETVLPSSLPRMVCATADISGDDQTCRAEFTLKTTLKE